MSPVSKEHGSAVRAVWMALIVTAGAGLSLVYACVTPFAALATLAALKTGKRDTALVVGLVWLANQAIGYAFLGYPRTWDSLAWGGAIGVAAGMALLAALALAPRRKAPFAISLPFVGAFTAYEFSLYLASFVLPTEDGAFSLSVVRQVFVTNALVLVVLIIAHWLATQAGLLARRPGQDDLDSALPAG
jgi:hypothetical protein